jgi:hypothetical protein
LIEATANQSGVAEFGWSDSTAQNYMNVARKFPTLGDMTGLTIDATALYVLSAPDVPQAARDQAVAQAESGKHVTKADAEALIADAMRKEQAKFAETVAKLRTEAAAALERWEDLDKAIDFLIGCQRVILQWWDDNVQEGGRPSKKPSHDRKMISKRDAQKEIRFDDSRLSRWRIALKDLDTYRERVTTAACGKALDHDARRRSLFVAVSACCAAAANCVSSSPAARSLALPMRGSAARLYSAAYRR